MKLTKANYNTPKSSDTRVVQRFAYVPTKVTHGKQWILWERYYQLEVYSILSGWNPVCTVSYEDYILGDLPHEYYYYTGRVK